MEILNKNIDGKFYAKKVLKKIYPLSQDFLYKFNRRPSLAVIIVGDNPEVRFM